MGFVVLASSETSRREVAAKPFCEKCRSALAKMRSRTSASRPLALVGLELTRSPRGHPPGQAADLPGSIPSLSLRLTRLPGHSRCATIIETPLKRSREVAKGGGPGMPGYQLILRA